MPPRLLSALLRFTIGVALAAFSHIVPKRRGRVVFGEWFGRTASRETWLEYCALTDRVQDGIWITREREVYERLRKQGVRVAMTRSLRGLWLQLTAETAIVNVSSRDLTQGAVAGSRHFIQLGHGVPVKKFLLAEDRGPRYYWWLRLRNLVFDRYTEVRCPFPEFGELYATAYGVPIDRVRVATPRSLLEIEETTRNSTRPRTVVYYMPTHRDEGRTFEASGYEMVLDSFLSLTSHENLTLVIRPHPYDLHNVDRLRARLTERDGSSRWRVVGERDEFSLTIATQDAILLITDYSGVVYEFAAAGVPVILFHWDSSEFDREFLRPRLIRDDDIAYSAERLKTLLRARIVGGREFGALTPPDL